MISHQAYLYDRLTALETLRIWARLLGRPATDFETYVQKTAATGVWKRTPAGRVA